MGLLIISVLGTKEVFSQFRPRPLFISEGEIVPTISGDKLKDEIPKAVGRFKDLESVSVKN